MSHAGQGRAVIWVRFGVGPFGHFAKMHTGWPRDFQSELSLG